MKTLSLELWRVAEIGPLIHANPNLCTLDIQGYSANESYFDNAVVDRAKNQEFQLQKSWKMLDSVHANIVELYALSINCKIHSLNVADGLYNIQHIEMLCAILADCRPSNLRIYCEGFKTDRFPDIPRSIPSELVEVDLWVHLEEFSTFDELDRFLVSMLSVVRSLPVLSFDLNLTQDFLLNLLQCLTMEKLTLSLQAPDFSDLIQFRTNWNADDEGGPLPEPLLERHAMEPILRDLNMNALAHRIMSTIPSLQSLYLSVSFHEGGRTYGRAPKEEDR